MLAGTGHLVSMENLCGGFYFTNLLRGEKNENQEHLEPFLLISYHLLIYFENKCD